MGSVFFVELKGEITRNEPDEDYIFFENKDREVDLPKKHIRFNIETIVIPEWLAKDKKLI